MDMMMKAQSKPMSAIVKSLNQNKDFQIIIFGDEVI